jgi:hypothetical protein
VCPSPWRGPSRTTQLVPSDRQFTTVASKFGDDLRRKQSPVPVTRTLLPMETELDAGELDDVAELLPLAAVPAGAPPLADVASGARYSDADHPKVRKYHHVYPSACFGPSLMKATVPSGAQPDVAADTPG